MLQAIEERTLRPIRTASTLKLTDITGKAERLADFDGHERVWLGEDEVRGLTAIVAIHNTALGPALGGSGNPSPVTAHGTYLGIKAALKHRTGADDVAGIRIAVQGLGSVGRSLCERLHADGASLTVADIDKARVDAAVEAFGAQAVSSETIVAAHLLRRGVLYAPDYVINSGGLVNVAMELMPDGYDRAAVMAKVDEIPDTLARIFERADKEGRPTNDVAQAMAERIIGQAQAA